MYRLIKCFALRSEKFSSLNSLHSLFNNINHNKMLKISTTTTTNIYTLYKIIGSIYRTDQFSQFIEGTGSTEHDC